MVKDQKARRVGITARFPAPFPKEPSGLSVLMQNFISGGKDSLNTADEPRCMSSSVQLEALACGVDLNHLPLVLALRLPNAPAHAKFRQDCCGGGFQWSLCKTAVYNE